MAGRTEQAEAAAEEAGRLAERLHYPVGEAATGEAQGACASNADEAAKLLEEARARWIELGRPLDAARCLLVEGRLLLDAGEERAEEVLTRAAEEYEALEVPALARRARELVAA
jgi:hypothetical protein